MPIFTYFRRPDLLSIYFGSILDSPPKGLTLKTPPVTVLGAVQVHALHGGHFEGGWTKAMPGAAVQFDQTGLNTLSIPIMVQWRKKELVTVWPKDFAKASAVWHSQRAELAIPLWPFDRPLADCPANRQSAPMSARLSPYSRDGDGRAHIEGPRLLLEPDTAQAIAITLHELATNAAKYGALSVSDGRVCVEWSQTQNGRVTLRWTETNGPAVKPPTHNGFGTRVIETMIGTHLKGQVRFVWSEQGLACEIAW